METFGFTDAKVKDVDTVMVGLRGCSLSDSVSYELSVTALNGEAVNVMVCKGLLNQATIHEG